MKYFEVKCELQPFSETASDLLSAELAEIGFESFSPAEDGLLAYIQQSVWDEDRMRQVVEGFCLPDVTISITPRLAFGTGSHQTTRLILRTLAQLDLKGKHVIDAGTGTGILAIMAIKRGAASVFAYDIDEWSVENTKDNLLLNHIQTLQPPFGGEEQGARSKEQENRNQSQDSSEDTNLLPLVPCSLPPSGCVAVVCGDSSVLEGREQADLLIANINRNILLADLPRFAKAVKEKGKMILSGFYLADVPVLVEATVQHGFSLLRTENEEEWAMLLFEADALGRRDV